MLTSTGGARERQGTVTRLERVAVNIVAAYAGRTHLADIAWRPHVEELRDTDGLFICG